MKALGIFHWKNHQGLGSVPGIADIPGIYKGRPLAIEVKAPKGKLAEPQKAFLDNWTREGGLAIVAWSVDDVIKGLEDKP